VSSRRVLQEVYGLQVGWCAPYIFCHSTTPAYTSRERRRSMKKDGWCYQAKGYCSAPMECNEECWRYRQRATPASKPRPVLSEKEIRRLCLAVPSMKDYGEG